MAPAAEAKVSSVSCLSLITLAFLVHSTVSFLLPSVHVAPPAAALRTGVATPGMSAVSCLARTSASLCSARSTTTRCGLHGNTNIGLRRKLRNAGLSMATEPHVLRLQAAELGQRLKVCCVADPCTTWQPPVALLYSVLSYPMSCPSCLELYCGYRRTVRSVHVRDRPVLYNYRF